MTGISRKRVLWLHDAATELASTKLRMTMKPEEVLQLTTELLAGMDAEPVVWDYEWASCVTYEGPQGFKRVIEREAPPEWAIDEGRARDIIPLYRHPQSAPDSKQVDELTIWIKRLAHSLKYANQLSKLPGDAMEYLSRKGLISVEDVLR
ncbi:TPA: hypothetical protein RCG84_000433 [Enterobacter roggenkampii]|uniref:hypothetical protein n=1 Tax=Enterobacter sp. CPE_E1241 TaxID=3376801 RepID=UPI0027FD2682|nr:hypothetical protein [Enterobacter roggenkampii]